MLQSATRLSHRPIRLLQTPNLELGGRGGGEVREPPEGFLSA